MHALLAIFWALKEKLVGTKPTRVEYEEGRDDGLTTLLQRMKRDGFLFTPKIKEIYVRSKKAAYLELEYVCVKLKRYIFL